MVFQDPFAALNPTKTLGYALSRPLRNYQGMSGAQARRARGRAAGDGRPVPARAATWTSSPTSSPAASASGSSSPARWRRDPELLVADEPISMLDVSIRAEILELLDTLVRDARHRASSTSPTTCCSARLLADDVLVLHEGQVVEQGPRWT